MASMKIENGTQSQKRVGFRAVVSTGLLLSFVAAAAIGIVMLFRPENSPAAWTFLGVDREGWGETHKVFVLILLGFTVLHLLLNGATYRDYFRRKKP
jgi:tellurite resistance protein TehA-like permease